MAERRVDREVLRSGWRGLHTTKLCDLLQASPLFLWYGLSAASLMQALVKRFADVNLSSLDLAFCVGTMAQAASLVFVVMLLTFVLMRRPAAAKAKGLHPRIAAVAGTYLPVAIVWLPEQHLGVALLLLSLLLTLGGVGFSIFSLAHLGRSFSLMAEARRLVTTGPYAWIRHPLYLGEALSLLGVALQYFSPLALSILVLQFAFQLQRMKNEEQVLSALFPDYEAYRLKTARLLPGVY